MAREAQDGAPETSREFEVEGTTWVARVSGRGLTGGSHDAGAPLLLVTFHPVEASAAPEKELLLVGTSLDTATPEDLVGWFARSVPFKKFEPPERPKRRGRHGGRP